MTINTNLVMHTISDTNLFVKHIAAKHFKAGIWRIVYRDVISRASNGTAPAWDNIFWSFELWQIGTKIFATHDWHCTVFSDDARPIQLELKYSTYTLWKHIYRNYLEYKNLPIR